MPHREDGPQHLAMTPFNSPPANGVVLHPRRLRGLRHPPRVLFLLVVTTRTRVVAHFNALAIPKVKHSIVPGRGRPEPRPFMMELSNNSLKDAVVRRA